MKQAVHVILMFSCLKLGFHGGKRVQEMCNIQKSHISSTSTVENIVSDNKYWDKHLLRFWIWYSQSMLPVHLCPEICHLLHSNLRYWNQYCKIRKIKIYLSAFTLIPGFTTVQAIYGNGNKGEKVLGTSLLLSGLYGLLSFIDSCWFGCHFVWSSLFHRCWPDPEHLHGSCSVSDNAPCLALSSVQTWSLWL